MAVNQVIFNNQTLIDISDSTVTSDKLIDGFTCYDKSGTKITGSYKAIPLEPYIYDHNIGYIANGTWKYENPTNTYTDFYRVKEGFHYFITLGANVGSRFRAMFTTTDVSTSTTNVAGTQIINLNNPPAFRNVSFQAPSDGYILVAKDNIGKSGIKTYVYSCEEAWL